VPEQVQMQTQPADREQAVLVLALVLALVSPLPEFSSSTQKKLLV
jgi:hypothetical protein